MLRHFFIAALIGAAFSCSPKKTGQLERATAEETSSTNQVSLTTSLGEIIIELNPEKAPISVENFLIYVDSGYYDSTLFHLVIDGYMIGGGEIDENRIEKEADAPIENESRNGLKNDRGTIAMARKIHPDSATSGFFINLNDNIALNYPQPDGHGYAVFGRVVSGMEVVDKIAALDTDIGSLTRLHPTTGEPETRDVADVPIDPVLIISAKRIEK